jgi:hypothetical protein
LRPTLAIRVGLFLIAEEIKARWFTPAGFVYETAQCQGLVVQHHQGDDRDDGQLEEGRADRQEPHFVFCFFIHHRQRVAVWIVPGVI